LYAANVTGGSSYRKENMEPQTNAVEDMFGKEALGLENQGASLKDIVMYPNPLLREKSSLFLGSIPHDGTLQKLMNDMVRTMTETRAMGLSAIQVGVPVRVLVVMTDDGPVKMVNPVVKAVSGNQWGTEGCLSLPFIYTKINRPEQTTVTYLNEKGDSVTFEYEGVTARAVLHEIDHLDGVLFLDKMNFVQRESTLKKFKRTKKKMQRDFGE
jgi:peptide deformylase